MSPERERELLSEIHSLRTEVTDLRTQLKQIQIRKQNSHQGNKKLTIDQVIKIRALKSEGLSLNQIAERFGITTVTVSTICRNKSWKLMGD